MMDLKKTCSLTGYLLALLVALSSVVTINIFADDIVPNTFTPGTTISANQVNQNFQALSNTVPRNYNTPGANATLTSTYQNLATLTLTPKDSGIALLLGSAGITLTQGYTEGGSSWGTTTATICITRTSGGGPGTPDTSCFPVMLDTPPLHVGDPVQPYSPRLSLPLTLVHLAPVTRDTQITFYLTAASDYGPLGSAKIGWSSMNATFFRPGM